jgi:DNA polymerase IV
VRAILHVDMDAFYAAIEQRDDPALADKPVIIAHSGPRGVVSTCSYEARRFGVRSAMPTANARRLCPQGVYIEPRLAHYQSVSQGVFAVFEKYTPEIEGLSLDEAFLDVSASLNLFGAALGIGQMIKRDVRAQTGLNCSVGLAHNKLLAKMASELCKPNGLLHLAPDQIHARLDPLPVQKLWTIGRVAGDKLASLGIATIGDLRSARLVLLQKVFGQQTESVLKLANGIDERPVQAGAARSIGAETTVAVDISELADARALLMRLVEKVSARLRHDGSVAATLTLKLRKPPFETQTRQRQLSPARADTHSLFQCADQLLQSWWQQQQAELAGRAPKLRLLGVSASALSPVIEADTAAVQQSLFDAPKPVLAAQDTLSDQINRRFAGDRAPLLTRARALKPQDPNS